MNEATPEAIKASRDVAVDALLKIKWYCDRRSGSKVLADYIQELAREGLDKQLDALTSEGLARR